MPATDRHVDALAGVYAEAERQLELLVTRALGTGALGTARYREAQLREVRAILSDLQDAAVPRSAEMVAASYAHGKVAVETAMGWARSPFVGVHQEAIGVLADNLANRLNEAATRVGRGVEDTFRREGLRHSAALLAEGATRREVSGRLAAQLASRGISAFEARNGAQWGLETYARMVIRTTSAEAVSTAAANRTQEAGQDLVEVSSHAHEEDECSDYDGGTFSLTGATEGYEVLDELPPFHPNCRHVIAPAAAIEDVEAGIDDAETLDELFAAVGA